MVLLIASAAFVMMLKVLQTSRTSSAYVTSLQGAKPRKEQPREQARANSMLHLNVYPIAKCTRQWEGNQFHLPNKYKQEGRFDSSKGRLELDEIGTARWVVILTLMLAVYFSRGVDQRFFVNSDKFLLFLDSV